MKKFLSIIAISVLLMFTFQLPAFSQGCVSIKNMPCTNMSHFEHDSTAVQKIAKWQIFLGYRYFKSYKHFVGDQEQKQRVELGTEVINISHSFDLSLYYEISSRLVASINFPILFYNRSSLYEHYGNSNITNPASPN